jgi:flagellar motor switch protein FliM
MEKDKFLSQKEIDALLTALPKDGSPLSVDDKYVGTARAYDFRSPDKFSKEQIRTLQMIHENFARRLGSSLSAYLRTAVQLACVHIEQGSFADFKQNLTSPSVMSVLSMAPLPGRILLATDAPTATIMLDRLLGGFGRAAREDHEVTDLEQSLMRGVMTYIVEGLKDAWRNVITLDVMLEETALNPEYVQVALPSDAAVFLAFEIKIHENNGILSICIPYSVLKPISSELSPHAWVAGEARETAIYREALLRHLEHVTVDVAVLLGEAEVDFEDLLQLQHGDVLVLNSVIGRPLSVLVGDTQRYHGQPGLLANHMAVQIATMAEVAPNG